ncbi:MAG: phosphoenolpyruvate synthase [Lachnospiraceae bacterium]|nr:phosphoenolpyruvate synthase [Lachnospiraceae bacterium]
MNGFILSFDMIGKGDVFTAGGKGANLGEMTRAGIAVPAGGVLTAQAYDHYMDANSIDTEGITEDGAKALRDKITGGTFPDDMKKEIIEFYRSLGSGRVAVRSSATAEDLEDASFAGQQETYLNVRGEEELLQKIKECYASLWGDRAVNYRKNRGYDSQKVALAVVIQQMVESESAGVLFTKDPSQLTDDIVINASYGLGEAVVSGMVSPDEYRCDRKGKIRKCTIGTKEVMIVYSGDGTKRTAVDEKMQKNRVLSDEMTGRLSEEALKIEAHYGHPMDIEWAVRDNNIYILQARSITTIDNEKPAFTEEDFAHLPKTGSASGKMRESILFNLEKMPVPYLPLDHDFGDNIGRQKQVLLSDFGIDMKEMVPIDSDGISSFCMGGFRLNKNVFGIIKSIRFLKDDEANIRSADDKLAECQKRLDGEKGREHGTVAELGEALGRLRTLTGDTAYARFRYAIFPQVVENITLEKKLKKADGTLSSFDLMEGLSYVTADINRDMAVIAEKIRADRELADDVMKLGYEKLMSARPALKESFDDFLKKYGNRSDFNCYCFTSHSWNEDPERFLNTLRTLVRSENLNIPSKEEGERRFNELMGKMKRTLGRKAYGSFEKKVMAVRHYHYIREATQYLWESIFAYCRILLKELADRLLADYDDLLYLFADELYKVCRKGEIDDESLRLIEDRKAKRPLAAAYWNRSIEQALSTGKNEISGVCGSAGQAAGRVRIVRSGAEFYKLRQGEILVCPYTDPEWTPLFTLAAAVVVDTGGTLSHAAIVAREYKIPCVLAAGNATFQLHDGDTVIVDGSRGKVYRR